MFFIKKDNKGSNDTAKQGDNKGSNDTAKQGRKNTKKKVKECILKKFLYNVENFKKIHQQITKDFYSLEEIDRVARKKLTQAQLNIFFKSAGKFKKVFPNRMKLDFLDKVIKINKKIK